MSWAKRINNKSYAFGTVLNLGFANYAGWPSYKDMWWLTFVVISAVLNHYFTVKALSTLIDNRLETRVQPQTSRILLSFTFKTIFLGAGFICLMVFASNKVLHGLTLYIFQLIIFGLSIKNIGKFFNKGNPE